MDISWGRRKVGVPIWDMSFRLYRGGKGKMEQVMTFLTQKIPLGEGVAKLVDFMLEAFGKEFRVFSSGVTAFIEALEWTLLKVHPLLLIALITIISWLLKKSKKTSLFTFLGLLLIPKVPD